MDDWSPPSAWEREQQRYAEAAYIHALMDEEEEEEERQRQRRNNNSGALLLLFQED